MINKEYTVINTESKEFHTDGWESVVTFERFEELEAFTSSATGVLDRYYSLDYYVTLLRDSADSYDLSAVQVSEILEDLQGADTDIGIYLPDWGDLRDYRTVKLIDGVYGKGVV